MPKKKQTKKIKYETEELYRWNLCQKLAKYAYRSTLSTHQIEENIELICENFLTPKKI